jgi:hypothetical protein
MCMKKLLPFFWVAFILPDILNQLINNRMNRGLAGMIFI